MKYKYKKKTCMVKDNRLLIVTLAEVNKHALFTCVGRNREVKKQVYMENYFHLDTYFPTAITCNLTTKFRHIYPNCLIG